MPTGTSIPGPIGKILTPQMEGLERPGCWPPHPAFAAPAAKCVPVRIPIPDLIRRLRNESYDQDGSAVVAGGGYKKNLAETMVWKGWELANRSPLLNEIGLRLAGKIGKRMPKRRTAQKMDACSHITQVARTSLHERARKEGVNDE
jgi:L-lactate dehydrogenase complex protein LldF